MKVAKDPYLFMPKDDESGRFRLRHLPLYPIALFLLFEEWGWNFLSAQLDKLERIFSWKKIERTMRNSSPWASIATLSIPFFLLLPLKFLGVFLLHKKQGLLGMGLIIVSKFMGTALFSKLFQITRPNLLHFKHFALWYPRWKKWKDKLISKIRHSYAWKIGHYIKLSIKRILSH